MHPVSRITMIVLVAPRKTSNVDGIDRLTFFPFGADLRNQSLHCNAILLLHRVNIRFNNSQDSIYRYFPIYFLMLYIQECLEKGKMYFLPASMHCFCIVHLHIYAPLLISRNVIGNDMLQHNHGLDIRYLVHKAGM